MEADVSPSPVRRDVAGKCSRVRMRFCLVLEHLRLLVDKNIGAFVVYYLSLNESRNYTGMFSND